jgi:hypothetical protein
MTKKVLCQTFNAWLPLAVVIVIFSGLAYAAVQQNYRQSANDPQIQIAEDIADAINTGKAQPDSIVSPEPTADISSSLATFAAIYSATGTPVGSSVSLDGKLPTLPSRIFDYARLHKEDHLTWQPKAGVRIAAVVVYFGGANPGFVLVGRSLREIEIREGQTELMSGLAGIIALVLTFIVMLYFTNKAMKPRVLEELSLDVKITENPPKPI